MIEVDDGAVRIARLELGPYSTNAYTVICIATGDSLLVDAPAQPADLLKALEGSNPRYVIMTHAHFDHVLALREVQKKLGIPVAAHPLEAPELTVKPAMELRDGDSLPLGKLSLRVLHTPGHTAGSLCLLLGGYLLSGDTIFPGGPGHTRSPAEFTQIVDSLVQKVFVLPDDTRVFPGHGASTVLGKEKKEFAAFQSRPHPTPPFGDVLWLSS